MRFDGLAANRTGPSAQVGAILGVEPSNVLATCYTDTMWFPPPQAGSSQAAMIDAVARGYGTSVDSPAALLKRTQTGNNEVLLAGTSPSGAKVAITGLMIRSTKDGSITAPDQMLTKIKAAAHRLGLPLVVIPRT